MDKTLKTYIVNEYIYIYTLMITYYTCVAMCVYINIRINMHVVTKYVYF